MQNETFDEGDGADVLLGQLQRIGGVVQIYLIACLVYCRLIKKLLIVDYFADKTLNVLLGQAYWAIQMHYILLGFKMNVLGHQMRFSTGQLCRFLFSQYLYKITAFYVPLLIIVQIPNIVVAEYPQGLGTEMLLLIDFTRNASNFVSHWLASELYFIATYTCMSTIFKHLKQEKFQPIQVYVLGIVLQVLLEFGILLYERDRWDEENYILDFFSLRTNANIVAFAGSAWCQQIRPQRYDNEQRRCVDAPLQPSFVKVRKFFAKYPQFITLSQIALGAMLLLLLSMVNTGTSVLLCWAQNVFFTNCFCLVVALTALGRPTPHPLLEVLGRDSEIITLAADGYLYTELYLFKGMKFGPMASIIIAVLVVAFGFVATAGGLCWAPVGRTISTAAQQIGTGAINKLIGLIRGLRDED